MAEPDLQVSRMFTQPECRGLGLAKYGVQEILRSGLARAGYYWYVVAPTNRASIQVAKANGFEMFGVGHKTCPGGLSRLGRIVVRELCEHDRSAVPFSEEGEQRCAVRKM